MPDLPRRFLLCVSLLLTACGGSAVAPPPQAPAASPILRASPASLAFAAVADAGAPSSQSVTVENRGGGTLAWQCAEAASWLRLESPTGASGDAFLARVDPVGLAPGSYTAAITLMAQAASNSPLQVPVTLQIDAATPSGCTCDPLPAPTNPTVDVSTTAQLAAAVGQANGQGGNVTIRLQDGTYDLAQLLHITAPDVTVRSLSGDRDAVVLRGDGMTGNVAHVFLVAAPRFTAADLTLGWVRYHGIQVQGEQDADDVLVHNVRFVDTGEQMLKVSYAGAAGPSGDRGTVRCCLFEYTAGIGPQYYIGGIDVHHGIDWVVRRNTFRWIRSPEAQLAEHAIHFWNDSAGTLVENNVIIDCDRGIGFGLGGSGHGSGLIRNNFVHTTRDVGIGLERAAGVRVLHNTVYADGYPNAIEYRFAETQATIVNNLVEGRILLRDGASGTVDSNYQLSQTDDVFVDAANGDLHLRLADTAIVDQARVESDAGLDIDCEPRPIGDAPDIGADEWSGS